MDTVDRVDTVVIGAGHAGLAVSHQLTAAGREHVVLERGRVGERWRSERWDSLQLLTPNWMTRLPGWYYAGPEPEGFMSARRFARNLDRYAAFFRAPVIGGTTVRSLAPGPDGSYLVHTDRGAWRTSSVVLATGPHGTPVVPAALGRTDLPVVTSNRYRNPGQLPQGGVLVVGASASGVQIADELAAAGRDVVLAVGRHTRVPRSYRGMDIFWWLTASGRRARTIESFRDPETPRHEPSLQLIGRAGHDVDLGSLQRRGVRLAGRLQSVDDGHAVFTDNLAGELLDADRRMHRLLNAFDCYGEEWGMGRELLPSERPAPVAVEAAPTSLDLRRMEIGSIVVAAGFRPDLSFVDLPILAADGSIEQNRGVTRAPGVYAVGQRFQHRRDSAFIDGARYDVEDVVGHLTSGARRVSA